jgi:hypothetical protein
MSQIYHRLRSGTEGICPPDLFVIIVEKYLVIIASQGIFRGRVWSDALMSGAEEKITPFV